MVERTRRLSVAASVDVLQLNRLGVLVQFKKSVRLQPSGDLCKTPKAFTNFSPWLELATTMGPTNYRIFNTDSVG
jgi:hypothetical protein